MLLADAGPTGSSLAIVGVIFLVFIAVCVGVIALLVRFFLRRRRRHAAPPAPPIPAAEQELRKEGLTE